MLLGDEAIAQAGIDAGMSGIYAYPGTPSTEITEYIIQSKEAKSGQIRAGWSTNEKTAMESAIGMSYAGKRAMVCMKHVGLNVAADAFINSAITGANGGLIVGVRRRYANIVNSGSYLTGIPIVSHAVGRGHIGRIKF